MDELPVTGDVLQPRGLPGPSRVATSAVTDRTDKVRRGRGRQLTPSETVFVEDLAKWGPITDEMLARVRTWSGQPSRTRDAIRKHVAVPRRQGFIDAYHVLQGGAKARYATSAGYRLVGLEGPEDLWDWTRLQISRHLLSLDAALQVLPNEHVRLVPGRVVSSFGPVMAGNGMPHTVVKWFDVPGVGMQEWVPTLSYQEIESERIHGVYVHLDPVPEVVLQHVLPRRGYVSEPATLATFDPAIADQLHRGVLRAGADSWCDVRLCRPTLALES